MCCKKNSTLEYIVPIYQFSSTVLFNIFFRVWLKRSERPLYCGWYGVMVIWLYPYCASSVSVRRELNSPPLLLTLGPHDDKTARTFFLQLLKPVFSSKGKLRHNWKSSQWLLTHIGIHFQRAVFLLNHYRVQWGPCDIWHFHWL